MFESIKRTMVVGAIVAMGAMAAPAMASADQWSADGVTVGGAPGVAVTGSGTLSFTMNIGIAVTTTCDVQMDADLYNQGGVADGQVTGFGVASPVNDCTVVGVSNCEVTSVFAAVAPSVPWAIDTVGTSATIAGVNFYYAYGRIDPASPCALQGTRNMAGNVTATWSNAQEWLAFTNATGLLINGTQPTTVNGALGVVGAAGEAIALS